MVQRPLSDRLAAERARIAKAQDRVRKLEAQERRTDQARLTRRKILLGTLVLQELETGGAFAGDLQRWLGATLPAALTRDTDRMLMAELIGGETASISGAAGLGEADATGRTDTTGEGEGTMEARSSPADETEGEDDETT